jgi:calcineurin-like phosphoesterase
MTGPYTGVIGVDKQIIIERFLTQMPVRMEAARHGAELHGVVVEVDESTGRASAIRRIALT